MMDIYNLIINEELTWEGLIRDIVREEGMDPWDINIAQLARRFANEVRKMKEINLRISGKFILTASILLKMKSDYLLNERRDNEENNISLAWLFKDINYNLEPTELTPRIPMKKKRKVTLEELIDALKKAVEVNERRINRHKEKEETQVKLKLDRVDLGKKIIEVYDALASFFKRKKEVRFEELLPSHERFDMLWTFIPLVHLSNDNKILLHQEKTFGDIIVRKA